MSLENLTAEQQERLRRLATLNDQRLESLIKLADKESELLDMLERNRAYGIVMATTKRLAGWMMVIAGAVALGSDSIKSIILSVVQ